ncbi:hypothetical protein JCM19038_2067 [Geomicrobium sp. JCM 19038]|nr:hypothetical protein JCM19038_2067 [Geomicrobium sp. JCM 19038]
MVSNLLTLKAERYYIHEMEVVYIKKKYMLYFGLAFIGALIGITISQMIFT